MATELKLIFQNPQSASLLKTLVFGGLLILVKIGGFGLAPILFFLVIAAFLFFRPFFQTTVYFIPFALFIFLGLLFLARLPDYYFWIGVVFLALLFYILLGIKNLVLVDRFRVYWLFNLALFYLTFLLFFSSSRESGFILKLLGVFFIFLLLFRDLFKFRIVFLAGRHQRSAISWILALLIFETVWAVSLLPIGFLQSANLALITVFILQDLSLRSLQGSLNRRAILTNITIFALVALLIFITASWSL